MNPNQQFAVSCHILTILAAYPEDAVTSETIAQSVDTNPVVIRRVMAHLRLHGLVGSRPGTSGGWRLLRSPSDLTLGDVYRAVSHEGLLSMHQHPNPFCPIGGNIQEALGGVFSQAQVALEKALDEFSVENILENTLRGNSQT
jgi:Rrf2 family protein